MAVFRVNGRWPRLAIVPPTLHRANITQDTARLSIPDKNTRDFVYYAFQGRELQKCIKHHTIGQAVKGINIAEVRRLPIPLPEKEELAVIVGIFRQKDNRIIAANAQQQQLVRLKAALSQALLMGRTRVR